jgi:hypothetical protein
MRHHPPDPLTPQDIGGSSIPNRTTQAILHPPPLDNPRLRQDRLRVSTHPLPHPRTHSPHTASSSTLSASRLSLDPARRPTNCIPPCTPRHRPAPAAPHALVDTPLPVRRGTSHSVHAHGCGQGRTRGCAHAHRRARGWLGGGGGAAGCAGAEVRPARTRAWWVLELLPLLHRHQQDDNGAEGVFSSSSL